MKGKLTTWIFILVMCNCKNRLHNTLHGSNVVVANRFIDAFYSFNSDSLQNILASAKKSSAAILYYQKWAECGNYQIVNRVDYFEQNDSTVIFPVTVKDDLIAALNIDFNVTDTFKISFQNGKIISVKTSSNDPDLYNLATKWVNKNRSELVEKECDRTKEPSTPCTCVRGMVKGFVEFAKNNKNTNTQK